MKIGELAEAAGLTAKTVRFYEGEGILPPAPRMASGYRSYGPSDIERLTFVRQAKLMGLSLDEIKETLSLHDSEEPTCVHVRGLLDEKIAHVDKVLADLRQFRKELGELRVQAADLVDCHPSGGNVCGIVERSEITLSVQGLNWISSGQAAALRKGGKR